MMKVIMTGGGTGGHIYPALAIAQGILDNIPDSEVLYVGGKNSMEKELAGKAGFPFYEIEVAPLPRKLSLQTLKNCHTAWKAVGKARKLVKEYQPDLIIGTGGYVCGPMVLAGHLAKVPTMIHEQNAVPGKTNKLLGRMVDRVCLGFPNTAQCFPKPERCVYTGLPVRKEILAQNKADSRKVLGLPLDKPVLLVTGGSQGAHAINAVMEQLYNPLLAKGIEIRHITGKREYEKIQAFADKKNFNDYPNLHLLAYGYHMEHCLTACDLVVGRAGASFIAEVTAVGRPSILIPYPYAVYNHQEANGRVVEKKGGAVVLLEKDMTAQRLEQEICSLLLDKTRLAAMAEAAWQCGNRHAVEDILKEIRQLVQK
ncbi:MAG: undecaprenyldiphospho-muramoylpentapeptide beta-N-acetylglucosaminyltransferase [Peptococcaceae bacterium]|jgi:UDP-N-acetylglucosamine--N-acetylmuramyl-(pentapeptide) pyrophosphoryl-undecaprenol N-acetylglucosamine transferase|nr:undecaprenyldiphospho-muramoylpentapeptide beta-N-acetylglucosaminyltransferase [Peptococcaceae bacterium]